MADRTYIVTVAWPAPIVHDERVTVTADGAENACFAVACLAAETGAGRRWPIGATFSARAINDSSYRTSFVDSDYGPLAQALVALAPSSVTLEARYG